MRRSLAVIAACAVFATGTAHAQTNEKSDVKLKIIGRLQTQFSTTSVDEQELIAAGRAPASAIPSSIFETRRIRLGAELEYQKWMTGKLEAELGMARLAIRDAYLNMAFDPRLQLRVGQFKKPFSLLQLTSSSIWPVIERGVRIRGLSESLLLQDSLAGGDRVLQRFRGSTVVGEEQELLERFLYQNFDLGAAVHGRFGAFAYNAGIFNGAGADRPDDTDEKSYAGRIAYKAPTELPITIGGAVSYREFRVTSRPAVETRGGTAFEADIEVGAFRRAGLHFLGEITVGDNLQEPEETFLGAQGIVAYFNPVTGRRIEGLEFAGRASYGDPRQDVSGDSGWLLTPGFNVYFFGRNRVMFNWDVFVTGDRFENENALRAQAQFYF